MSIVFVPEDVQRFPSPFVCHGRQALLTPDAPALALKPGLLV